MNRRASMVAAAVAAATTLAAASAKADELFLFNWTNYTSPEVIEKFEQETGISVTLDVYTSNEDLMARLRAGGGGYDIALPSDSYVARMIEEDMLHPFDARSLPNFRYVLDPHDEPYYDPERRYSAPYMWGTTGIGYHRGALRDGEELEHSWAEVFEPREQFAGEIGMLNEIGDVIQAAAFYLEIDPCTEEPSDWQQIQDLLVGQKDHVKAYNATGTDASLISGEILMHQMWNGAAHRAWREDPDIDYLYPEEGVVFWADNMVIPAGARNVENAKKFINFMMDPEVAAMTSNYTGYSNTIDGASAMLSDDLRESPAVNVPAEFGARLKMIPPCSQRSDELRDRVWTRVMR